MKTTTPFIIMAIVAAALAAISFCDDAERLYTSVPMLLLWAVLCVVSLFVIIKKKLYRRPLIFLLHLSFVIILVGAAATHFFGRSETLHLRVGDSVEIAGMDVELVSFDVDYYPGTSAPSDYRSALNIDGQRYTVAMNKVAEVGAYRFFQTSYDSDRMGSVLTLTYDPAGTAVTYAGYLLLFVCMALCLFPRRLIAAVIVVLFPLMLSASEPRTLPRDLAAQFGELFVFHNGRIAPVSSLAGDFTRKLAGTSDYGDLSAEQVLTGWLFFYDDWKTEPCLKIKDKSTRAKLGNKKYVALADFFGPEGYRLSDSGFAEANEKFSVASSAATGSLWKIFPYTSPEGTVEWLSPVDEMPSEMAEADWHIARHSLNYIARLVAEHNYGEVSEVLSKIARYQRKQAGPYLPSPTKVACERAFRAVATLVWLPAALLVVSLLLLLFPARRLAVAVCALSALVLAVFIGINLYVSGHIPLTNGPETMRFMALCALVVPLLSRRMRASMCAVGAMVAALALMVSAMGQSTPVISNLMPVLNSPLLSIHVLAVMIAYSLLAIMAVSGMMWLCGRKDMLTASRRMLRPAVFALAAGIFIGAIWANVSWGRYWGWDSKEVWALITMLVYAFPLHARTMPSFGNDRFFAIYSAAAFVCVLMTYFGVNYVLGGLHSYA